VLINKRGVQYFRVEIELLLLLLWFF